MDPLVESILQYLYKNGSADSLGLSKTFGKDHQKIIGGIKSLECFGNVIQTDIETVKEWVLSDEGKLMVTNGSHEAVVFNAIPDGPDGIPQPDLMKKAGPAGKVGFSKAMSNGWLVMDKSSGKPIVKKKVSAIEDTVQKQLVLVEKKSLEKEVTDEESRKKLLQDFKKRKLVQEIITKVYKIKKGEGFTLTVKKAETELTPEMITSGSWKNAEFKPYNFDALGIQPAAGYLHPLMKVRAEYRQIFFEMGFTEMPTNNYVESSFWNFDALFQPQQHPARDAHDTFFISDPASASDFPKEYLEKVKNVHSKGGFGSQGYGYDWKIDEARKNLLRTHTTAVSARMLYKLAQGEFKPAKYFSIDRVFRNETLDATHLAEFQQIEGVIADRGLTLGDLIGVLYQFFKKLGIEKLRFKPAYNPYTEPSMEIFSYHEGLKKWVEVGNSGIFRPEMLLPMGLPEDVNVIAWGLSLERPTMIKYGIDNIRDLVGHKVNLKMVQDNPICRLDKNSSDQSEILARVTENRWIEINRRLNSLTKQITAFGGTVPSSIPSSMTATTKTNSTSTPREIVIFADPTFPPYSLPVLLNALKSSYSVAAQTHVHSSVSEVPQHLQDFFHVDLDSSPRSQHDLCVSFVWKSGRQPSLAVSPIGHNNIEGEVNIAKYLVRTLEQKTAGSLLLDSASDSIRNLTEGLLDEMHAKLMYGDPKTKQAFAKDVGQLLETRKWLNGESLSVADIVFWSLCRQAKVSLKDKVLKAWSERLVQHEFFKN